VTEHVDNVRVGLIANGSQPHRLELESVAGQALRGSTVSTRTMKACSSVM
jgi:hypothetical protein